jgi:hypothetical protein
MERHYRRTGAIPEGMSVGILGWLPVVVDAAGVLSYTAVLRTPWDTESKPAVDRVREPEGEA